MSRSTIFQSFWDGFLGLISTKQWGFRVVCPTRRLALERAYFDFLTF